MLACSFLIKSSSKLLVIRTGVKALSSLILGRLKPLILELLALEWRKFHTFELEYLWSQFASLDQILCIASLGLGKGHIRFWGRLTMAYWTQVSDRCPLGYLFFTIYDAAWMQHSRWLGSCRGGVLNFNPFRWSPMPVGASGVVKKLLSCTESCLKLIFWPNLAILEGCVYQCI